MVTGSGRSGPGATWDLKTWRGEWSGFWHGLANLCNWGPEGFTEVSPAQRPDGGPLTY